MANYNHEDMLLPKSKAELLETQRQGKRRAVEMARQAGFWQGKLDHIDLERLDDPAEWQKIPILDKEQLRAMSAEEFYRDFMIAKRQDIANYWRSGGSTDQQFVCVCSELRAEPLFCRCPPLRALHPHPTTRQQCPTSRSMHS